MTLILVIGLGIYLLMVNSDISKFYKLKIIYFIGLPLAIIVPIIVSIILEIKSKKDTYKKIVRNK